MKSFIKPKETMIDLGSDHGSFLEKSNQKDKTQIIGMSPLFSKQSPKRINLN